MRCGTQALVFGRGPWLPRLRAPGSLGSGAGPEHAAGVRRSAVPPDQPRVPDVIRDPSGPPARHCDRYCIGAGQRHPRIVSTSLPGLTRQSMTTDARVLVPTPMAMDARNKSGHDRREQLATAQWALDQVQGTPLFMGHGRRDKHKLRVPDVIRDPSGPPARHCDRYCIGAGQRHPRIVSTSLPGLTRQSMTTDARVLVPTPMAMDARNKSGHDRREQLATAQWALDQVQGTPLFMGHGRRDKHKLRVPDVIRDPSGPSARHCR